MEVIRTYNELLEIQSEAEKAKFALDTITDHKNSEAYAKALVGGDYVSGLNTTIKKYDKVLYNVMGEVIPDTYSPNHKTATNIFKRFVTQECAYLLGNGVKFMGQKVEVEPNYPGAKKEIVDAKIVDGKLTGVTEKWFAYVDIGTKERLGKNFDADLYFNAKKACAQSAAFGFVDFNKVRFFKLTEFAPLYDNRNGALCAGVQWWRSEGAQSPINFILYELDGFTTYRQYPGKDIEIVEQKRGYIKVESGAKIDTEKNYKYENYPAFPIVPLFANAERESELTAIRPQIDCYDLIKNGFANNIDEASVVYWVLQNAGGMDEQDLAEFRDSIKRLHVARATGTEGASAEAKTIDVPYQATEACLDRLKRDLYDDYMALDVEQISAGNVTATQIEAAYEPLDQKSSEFEFCITNFINGILKVMGIEDTPVYNRQKISNQSEYVNMIMSASSVLDEESILELLPFITPEQKDVIMSRKAENDYNRFLTRPAEPNTELVEEVIEE